MGHYSRRWMKTTFDIKWANLTRRHWLRASSIIISLERHSVPPRGMRVPSLTRRHNIRQGTQLQEEAQSSKFLSPVSFSVSMESSLSSPTQRYRVVQMHKLGSPTTPSLTWRYLGTRPREIIFPLRQHWQGTSEAPVVQDTPIGPKLYCKDSEK